jgi:uncharacterized glyoxalase superfamily protein PhnB
MGKVFVFAIGGTGSRVVKALTFLLASGVKINAERVVPIFIDPDKSNGDLNRTLSLLQSYQQIRNNLKSEPNLVSSENNRFFSADVVNWNQLTQKGDANEIKTQGFKWEILNSDASTFGDFIDFISLSDEDKLLVKAFFSDANLGLNLEVGFKGNPHIGSIVLNQFVQDEENFNKFANNFNNGDRIFIIGSIFGGTGAAGLPLLVKNLRNMQDGNNAGAIRNAKIGALLAMPYYGVNSQSDSEINSSQFIAKTKAALHYYDRTLKGQVDAMFYIGDDQKKSSNYHYAIGQKEQSNHANFIEVASALAVIDFMEMEEFATESTDTTITPYFKEFAVNSLTTSPVSFPNLSDATKRKIAKPMTAFHLAIYFINNYLENAIKKEKPPWLTDGTTKIETTFLSGSFYQKLSSFVADYNIFMEELSNNIARGFRPFKLGIKPSEISHIVTDIEPEKKKIFIGKDMDAEYLTHLMNSVNKNNKFQNTLSPEQKIMYYLNEAMKNGVEEKYSHAMEDAI